jgi:hypothetical protein
MGAVQVAVFETARAFEFQQFALSLGKDEL